MYTHGNFKTFCFTF